MCHADIADRATHGDWRRTPACKLLATLGGPATSLWVNTTETRSGGRKWLTVTDMTAELGITRSTLDKWREQGKGPKLKQLPSRKLRCERTDFDAWLDSLPVVP